METKEVTLKSLMGRDEVKNKFQEMLGKRATSFITSVLQIAASNELLAKAEPMSIYNAAATAATLDLPLNNNLGFAYIVPYKVRQPDNTYKTMAQFQLGYKGFKQLALRTGQFQSLNATDVREGELKKHDRLTGEMEFEWIQNDEERLKSPIIGYVSFFRLHNGFSQTLFMTNAELKEHGLKYSQTFKKGYGLWKDDNHGMCLKTVTKLNLSKNAPLSVEMQKGIVTDQGIITDEEAQVVEYPDNQAVLLSKEGKENERLSALIANATSVDELGTYAQHINGNAELEEEYSIKMELLKANTNESK